MTEIPKEIAEALFATAKAVSDNPLVKDMQNEFAKFKYVPIDSYYAAIPPLALKHGLFWRCHETEVSGEGKAFKFCYSFDLIHEGGATVEGYDTVTIYHPAQGAQSSGSARSYADKLFMRTAFKCVTGEKDSEYFHKEEAEDFDIGDADATDNSNAAANAEQLKAATPTPAPTPAPEGKDPEKMSVNEWREALLGHPENPVSMGANGIAQIAAPANSEGANLIMKCFESFMPRMDTDANGTPWFDSKEDCIKALREFYGAQGSKNDKSRKTLEEYGKEYTTKLLANFKAAKVAATNGEIWEEGK